MEAVEQLATSQEVQIKYREVLMAKREGSIQYNLRDKALEGITDDHTETAYKRYIKNFAEWARSEGINKVSKIEKYGKVEFVQKYERYLETITKSPSSIHSYLAPVCKGLDINMKRIDKPKRTAANITKGREASEKGARGAEERHMPQFRRLVTVQEALGLRRDELRRLTGKALGYDEFGRMRVTIRGKGGKIQRQIVLPQHQDTVAAAFKGLSANQRVFSDTEIDNKINLHGIRREMAREAYKYYAEKLEKEPGYKLELTKQLKAYWDENYYKDRPGKERPEEKIQSAYARFKDDIFKGGGIYRLRGENLRKAKEKGLPTEYNRMAMMAVSVFHLAHWRLDVTATNYLVE